MTNTIVVAVAVQLDVVFVMSGHFLRETATVDVRGHGL